MKEGQPLSVLQDKVTRRDFLVKGAATLASGVALASGFDSTRRRFEAVNAPETEPTELTYEQAMADALRFSALLKQVPDALRVGVRTQEDLDNWMAEIVPYFEYEGINADGEVGEFQGLVYPQLDFEDYQDGLLSHHVLGRAMIFQDDISLNARISNPVSAWYGREDSIGTLVHELAHANGVKFPAPYSAIDHEASAQLVTLEVLSAMVNHGNTLAVPALLDELSYMNMAAARYIALRDGDEGRFLADREQLFTDPFQQAAAVKADRQWADYKDEDKYPYILEAYNYNPMNMVYRGMRKNDEIYGVKLPINWLTDMVNSEADSSGSYYPEAAPEPYEPGMYANHPSPRPLIIDDLHYFYDHAEALVKGIL